MFSYYKPEKKPAKENETFNDKDGNVYDVGGEHEVEIIATISGEEGRLKMCSD